ncbi:MAG: hypothetical protein ACRD4M_03640 [Candidatus Acidiferrales bacterium]
MTSDYSAYDSITTDGVNIYVSETVDGTAGIHPSEYCKISPGTTHHGLTSITIGTTTTYASGSNVCPGCYISLTGSAQTPADVGVVYIIDPTGEVLCSAVGNIFDGGGGSYTVTYHNENYDFASYTNGTIPGFYNCTYAEHCEVGKAVCTGPANPVAPDESTCAYYWWWYFLQINGVCNIGPQKFSNVSRITCS